MSELVQELPANQIDDLEASSKGAGLGSYLRTLKRKAWLIAGITSLTTLAAFLVSSLESYTYQGSFYLLVEPITSSAKLTNPTTLARTQGVPNEELFALDYPTNLVFLSSPGMTLKIAKDVQAKNPERTVPAIWKDLRDNLKVDRVSIGQSARGETKIFQVIYQGEDPDEVLSVLKTSAQTFLKYSSQDRETNIKAGVKFLDKQLPQIEKRLYDLQAQQQKLRQQYNLIDPTSKGQEVFGQVNNLNEQLAGIQTQLKAQRTLQSILQQQLSLTPEEALAAASLSQDPNRQTLLAQLQDLDNQLAIESARFTFTSPALQALEDKRQNILALLNQKTQQLLAQNSVYVSKNSPVLYNQDSTRMNLIQQLVETANQIQILEVQQQSMLATRQVGEQQAKQYPALINQYNGLEQQIALTQGLLDKLLSQRETLKVEAAQELPWQLISPPQIPLDEDGTPIGSPPSRKKKIAAGVAGGLVLGSALALWLEKRRNFFYTTQDLKEALLPSIPLIGEIPDSDLAQVSPVIAPVSEAAVENDYPENTLQPEANFLKAFQSLYNRLCLLYNDPPVRSLVVCSVETQDGQSTVALYLAKAAAAAGKRVLLVDANLSNPQLHTWLNLDNYKGLNQLLADQLAPEEIIQSVPNVENLFALTTGVVQFNVGQRLWSSQMEKLMQRLQARYDLVIYDSAHFNDSAEVGFLANHTDGLLMVVAIAKTSQTEVKEAMSQINAFRLPVLGVVVNYLK